MTITEAEALLRAPGTSPADMVRASAVLMGYARLEVPTLPVLDAQEPLAVALRALYIASDTPTDTEVLAALHAEAALVDLRVQAPVAELVLALAEAARLQKLATAALTPEDQWALATLGEGPRTPEQERASEKVRVDSLAAAAVLLLETVQRNIPLLVAARDAGVWPPVGFRDPAMLIELGTEGADSFTTRRWLTLDPAGDDLYTRESNMGGASPQNDLLIRGWVPILAAVALDLGGNDRYVLEGLVTPSATQGCGSTGVGILWDAHGDDYYYGTGNSQGAGFTGVGVHIDERGDDYRRTTGGATHGAADRGIGILNDIEGNDHHFAGGLGFGWSNDRGVGTFKDEAGQDIYEAGSTGVFGRSLREGRARFYDLGGATDAYPTWHPLLLGRNNHVWYQGTDGIGEDS